MADLKQVAFLNAYKSCHDSFVRYCSALAYGKMDAEDLVQDVLLSAYQHFDKIEDKSKLLHYLIRSAKYKSISNWRKRQFKTEFIDLHDQRLISQAVSAETLLDIQMLYKMIDRLPERQKDALVLFEITGFSMKEIAKIHNSTEGAVKTKVSRARKTLSELLNKDQIRLSRVLGTLKTVTL